MKNRRIAIIAFVLVAVMAIGVGYAALTDTLTATGTASANPNNDAFDTGVVFVKAEGTGVTGEVDNTTAAPNTGDKITITIAAANLTKVGDTVVATVTVANNSDLDAKITAVTESVTGDTACIKATIDGAENLEIPHGTQKTFTITFEVIQTPDGEGDEVPFTYTLTATSQA